jgi:putative drug exporter of the RND superfamily
MSLSTESLARGAARRPWLTIMIWVLVLAGALLATGRFMDGALTMEDRPTNDLESYRAEHLVKKRMPGAKDIKETVVIDSKLTIDDPAYEAFTLKLQQELGKLDKKVIKGSVSYFQTGAPAMVSEDRRATIVPVFLAGKLTQAEKDIERVHRVLDRVDRTDDRFRVEIIGPATVSRDFKEVSDKDLGTGEKYGIMVAVVILTLVFGTLVSAVVPIILAVAGIIGAVGATALVGQRFDLSFFVLNMITMMGLAVGIDYTLFIVSRFREELDRGLETGQAAIRAGATAGRAVLFSGLTVLVSLIGMLIIPHTVFKSLGIGAMLVVLFSILASLTLLPAVLTIMGQRVNRLRLPFTAKKPLRFQDHRGFWNRTARAVMNHPLISLTATLALLVFLSASYLNIDLGSSMGPGNLPDGRPSKEAYKIMADKFAIGEMDTVQVVVEGKIHTPEVHRGIERLQAKLVNKPVFGPAEVIITEKGDLALLNVPVVADPGSAKAQDAVRDIRRYLPDAFNGSAEALVGGETASQIDFTKVIKDYTPIVFGVVLGLSFILLTLVFHSLVVPVKAILMNLLSVGAAYGLLVLVFQNGVGAELLGFERVEVIEMWLPLFLFSVLFGLSMDYHVFLLSRIKEHFDETGDNTQSVAFGLASTGRIITGAAVIMVAVFGGFAAGDLLMFQQMGFGLAAAVFLDATIVRCVLVPASMKLLGNRNWYLPKFLQWLPELQIEGLKEEDEEQAMLESA